MDTPSSRRLAALALALALLGPGAPVEAASFDPGAEGHGGAIDASGVTVLAVAADSEPAPADSLATGAPAAAPDTLAATPPDTLAAVAGEPFRRTRSGYRPRRILHDLYGTGEAVVSDLAFVVTSPLRMDLRDAAWLAAGIGATAVLYANDEAILAAFDRNRGDDLYEAVLTPGRRLEPLGLMGRTNPYYFGALTIGYAFDVRPLREIPAEILESHAISGGIRNGFKVLVGRAHPSEKQGHRHFDPGHGTSFPSGHSSVDFELATILSHHTPWRPLRVVWYTLASTMVLQRIDSHAHWPSDVLLSAASGALIARTVIDRHERRVARGRAMLGLVPVDGGVGIAATF